MPTRSDFHDKRYDAGTLSKLRIFELYTQEWIPVFLAPAEPKFEGVHIFDYFSGPGKDTAGNDGSQLRIPEQLRRYNRKGLTGWYKVRISAPLYGTNRLDTLTVACAYTEGE